MYIKLRYRARLARPTGDIETFADEVEDICRSNGWKYHRWAEDWSKPNSLKLVFDGASLNGTGHAPLRGISFSPHPECEPVWLAATPDGKLNSLHTLDNPLFAEMGGDSAEYPWNRVKTCFDGPVTHLAICNLLRFLEKKYFADLQVVDESGYWKHGDRARFEAWIDGVNRDHTILEEELAALEADKSLGPARKKETFYHLMKQFGQKHKPDTD